MTRLFRLTRMALCTLLLAPTVLCAKNNRQSLDGIAAVVNDTVITQSEVNTAANAMKAQMSGANMPLPPPAVLQQKVLEQVVDRKLQLLAAEQSGIKISDAELDQTINNIARQNGVTAEILYEKVATQNLTRAEYRKEIREELTLQQIEQQQVGSKVMMNPDDVKNFMRSREWAKNAALQTPPVTEYHIEDLVILTPDPAGQDVIAAAKTEAEALYLKAKQGASFASLVHPDDKNLENNDLGWRTFNDIPSAFSNQIATTQKGGVTAPIQTGNGFHIIRLIDLRQEKNGATAVPPPTEKEAEQMVYQRKFNEALKKWVAKLRSQAVINLHPDSTSA